MSPTLHGELSDSDLDPIFTSISNGTLSVETKNIEFKKGFGWSSSAKYMKTMAAFSNANGGYLIFGVNEKPCELVGLDNDNLTRFKNIDGAEVTENLKNQFNREIIWDKRVFSKNGLDFGVIYVFESKHKPIISTKDKDKHLRKSAIYFRYNSQSTEINPDDLEKLIEIEKNSLVNKLIEKIQLISTIGIDKSYIFDTATGSISESANTPPNIIIDPETINKIKFIKEGEFTEKEGAPALVLKGEIQDINVNEKYILREGFPTAILQNQIIENFLIEKSIINPFEYLKLICTANTQNFPIYYYIKNIEDKTTVISKLRGIESLVSDKVLNKLIDRLSSKKDVYYKPINAKGKVADIKKRYLKSINLKRIEIPAYQNGNGKNLNYFLQAIQAVKKDNIIKNKDYILDNLLTIYKNVIITKNCEPMIKTEFRKAVCWVDEALYRIEI